MTEAERNKQFTVREKEVDTLEFCVQIHNKQTKCSIGSTPETVSILRTSYSNLNQHDYDPRSEFNSGKILFRLHILLT